MRSLETLQESEHGRRQGKTWRTEAVPLVKTLQRAGLHEHYAGMPSFNAHAPT